MERKEGSERRERRVIGGETEGEGGEGRVEEMAPAFGDEGDGG